MLADGVDKIIDLHLDYAAHVDPSQTIGFRCTHGESECIGNMYQLCAYNLTTPSTSNYSWWEYFTCMDKDQSAVPNNAKSCAEKLGLDYAAIDACANSAAGKAFFTASIKRTEAAGVRGTPTTFIDGKEYYGDHALRTICQAYKGALCER